VLGGPARRGQRERSLIRYRGLSAGRTAVFPGHVERQGRRDAFLQSRPDQGTDGLPWPAGKVGEQPVVGKVMGPAGWAQQPHRAA